MSYLSYSTVSSSVNAARREAAHRSLPRDEEGSVLLADRRAIEDRYSTHTVTMPKEESPETALSKELEGLGRDRNRTRWLKGRGLSGEVEEEGEMRDTWLRPGVPRKDG